MSQASVIDNVTFVERRLKGNVTTYESNATIIENIDNQVFDFVYDITIDNYTQLPDVTSTIINIDATSAQSDRGILYAGIFLPVLNTNQQNSVVITGDDITAADAEVIQNFIQVTATRLFDELTQINVSANLQQLQAYRYSSFTVTIPVEESDASVIAGGVTIPMLRVRQRFPSIVASELQVRISDDATSMIVATRKYSAGTSAFFIKVNSNPAYQGIFTNVNLNLSQNTADTNFTFSFAATENIANRALATIYPTCEYLDLPQPNEDDRSPKPKFIVGYTTDLYRHDTGVAVNQYTDNANTRRLNYSVRAGFGSGISSTGVITPVTMLRLALSDGGDLIINDTSKTITVDPRPRVAVANGQETTTRVRLALRILNVPGYEFSSTTKGYYAYGLDTVDGVRKLSRIKFRSLGATSTPSVAEIVYFDIDPESYVYDYFFDLTPDADGNNSIESGTPFFSVTDPIFGQNYAGDRIFGTTTSRADRPYNVFTTDHRFRWVKWKHITDAQVYRGVYQDDLIHTGGWNVMTEFYAQTDATLEPGVSVATSPADMDFDSQSAPELSFDYSDGKTLNDFVEWFKDAYAGYGIAIDWAAGVQPRRKAQVGSSSVGQQWKNLPVDGTLLAGNYGLETFDANAGIYIQSGTNDFYTSGEAITAPTDFWCNVSNKSSIVDQLSTSNPAILPIIIDDITSTNYDTVAKVIDYIVDELNAAIVESPVGLALDYTIGQNDRGQVRFVRTENNISSRYSYASSTVLTYQSASTTPVVINIAGAYNGKTYYEFNSAAVTFSSASRNFIGSGSQNWSKSLSILQNTSIGNTIIAINDDDIVSGFDGILRAEAATTNPFVINDVIANIYQYGNTWPKTGIDLDANPDPNETLLHIKLQGSSTPYNRTISFINGANGRPYSISEFIDIFNTQQDVVEGAFEFDYENIYPDLIATNLIGGQIVSDLRQDNDNDTSTLPYYDFNGVTQTVIIDPPPPRYDISITYNLDFVGANDCIMDGVDAGVQVALGGYDAEGTLVANSAPNEYYEVGWNTFTPIGFTTSDTNIVYLLVRTRATTNRGDELEASNFSADALTYRAIINYSDGTSQQYDRLYVPSTSEELDAWTEDFGAPAVLAVPVKGEVVSIDIQDVCYNETVTLNIRNTVTEIDQIGFLAINNTNLQFSQQESQVGTSFGLILDTIGSWDILLTPESKLINNNSGSITYRGKRYDREIFDVDQGYDIEIVEIPAAYASFVTVRPFPSKPQIQIISIDPGVKAVLRNIRNARRDQESLEGCSISITVRVTGRRSLIQGLCSITIYYDADCVFDKNLCEYYWNLKELPKTNRAQVLQNTISITYDNLIDCQSLVTTNDNLLNMRVPALIKVAGIPMLESGTSLLLIKSSFNSIVKRFYYPVGSELSSMQLVNCDDLSNNAPLYSRLNRPYLLLPTSNTPITDPEEIASRLAVENSYLYVTSKFRTPNVDVIKDCGANEVVIMGVGFEFKNWRYGLIEHSNVVGFEYEFPEDVYTPPSLGICYRYYYNIYKT